MTNKAQLEKPPKTMFDLIREFTNARREQVDPKNEASDWVNSPSLWDLLLENTARGGGQGSSVQRSRPPVSTEVLSLIAEVRAASEKSLTLIGRKVMWQSRTVPAGEADRFRARPDSQIVEMWRDVPSELRAVCANAGKLTDSRRERWVQDLDDWIARAKAALGEAVPRIQLPRGTRCMDCGAAWVTSKVDGQEVRKPALHLFWHDDGSLYYVACLACGKSRWPADLHALAEHQRELNLEQETVSQ